MMMNFCCSSLNPSVSCSSVSNDGYEAINLVSDDPVRKQKGFLAYHAIKPPVTLTINFMCSVNLCHLVLWTQIGCQKSTGFEILCRSASKSKAIENELQEYHRIAFGYLGKDDVGIIFYRRVFNSEYQRSTSHLSNFARTPFFSNAYSFLDNVTSLQIKIIKTSSSVPALARIETWGQPGRSCDKVIRDSIFRLWNNRAGEKTVILHYSKNETEVISVTDSDKLNIPEEFLDAITCSIMAIPMILPSGKVVDQSTLEKHKECEANWGRAPSDPFTGRLFTETCRPILATALKARIDKFLIENCDKRDLWTVPRTVGMKECSSTNTAYINGVVSTFQQDSSEKLDGIASGSRKRPFNSNEYDKEWSTNSKTKCGETFKSGKSSIPDDEDDRSLTTALASTLASLPKYTTFNTSGSQSKESCASCMKSNTLFKLPCSHFVCRTCLVMKKQTNELYCNLCKTNFKIAEPVRYHL